MLHLATSSAGVRDLGVPADLLHPVGSSPCTSPRCTALAVAGQQHQQLFHGLFSDSVMSIPRAFASMRTRSRSDTMSWSRSCGDSSRRLTRVITATTRPAMPQMTNWSCHGCRLPTVLVAMTETTRLPTTGAERPEAHRGGPAKLRREVADQRRRGDEDDALDEADRAEDDRELPLAGRVGDADQGQQAGDDRP